MSEAKVSERIYDVPPEWKQRAYIDAAKYQEMYARSIRDPNGFWAEQAKRIDWSSPSPRSRTAPSVRAMSRSNGSRMASPTPPTTASTAICQNARNQTAIIWEGDDPAQSKHITYQRAARRSLPLANVLRNRGVKKGDRVTIYLPMIPEAAYAMLACARIGAIHSVVFGGFSPGFARRPHRGLQIDRRDHRRRRAARRAQGAAQGQRRCRDRQGRRRGSRHRGAAHRRSGEHGARARRLVPRSCQGRHRGMPVRAR